MRCEHRHLVASFVLLILILAGSVAKADDAIVLFATEGRAKPFDAASRSLVHLHTGDRVIVRKVQSVPSSDGTPDKESFNVEFSSTSFWVDGRSLFVFADAGAFGEFTYGTWPARQILARQNSSTLSEEKLSVLDSKDFYERELRNADPVVRAHAARRLFFFRGQGDRPSETVSDADALAILSQTLADPDVRVRRAALRSFEGIENAHPGLTGLPAFSTLLSSAIARAGGDQELADCAALLRFDSVAGRERLILQAAERGSGPAIALLNRLPSAETSETWHRLFAHPDRRIRWAAITAFPMDSVSDLDLLLKQFPGETPENQAAIVTRVGQIDAPSHFPKAAGFLKAVAENASLSTPSRLSAVEPAGRWAGQGAFPAKDLKAMIARLWPDLVVPQKLELLTTFLLGQSPIAFQCTGVQAFNEPTDEMVKEIRKFVSNFAVNHSADRASMAFGLQSVLPEIREKPRREALEETIRELKAG